MGSELPILSAVVTTKLNPYGVASVGADDAAPIWTDRTFRVMGTDARVMVLGGSGDLAERAETALHGLEARWSRFREDSELTVLNRTDRGLPVRVSEPTFSLIARAVDAWQRTGGRFDPTGLDAMVALGYDRDFASVRDDEPSTAARPVTHDGAETTRSALPGCSAIILDAMVHAVTLPVGVSLDLGGIGKGYAADLTAAELMAAGAEAVCVDLGGDVRVMGQGPYHDAWEVGFDDPVLAAEFGRVRFASGAVATSTRLRRQWQRVDLRRGAESVHHLLDPSTGVSAATGLATVTVVAGVAWRAEVLAKAAFVAGPTAGASLLRSMGVEGVLVADDGTVYPTSGFPAMCGTDTHSS